MPDFAVFGRILSLRIIRGKINLGADHMDTNLLLKAVHFAAQKHSDQKRKDRNASPYINHPISVAFIIATVGKVNNPEILAAALLHDTIEDTSTTPEELEVKFSPKIHRMILP